MATPPDVLRLKTDAELRFFVANPAYYQAELVTAARQELRRRGLAAVAPAPPSVPAPAAPVAAEAAPYAESQPQPNFYATPEAPPRGAAFWVLPASVAAVLLVVGLGFWHKARPTSPTHPPAAKVSAAPQPPASVAPRPLETAVAAPPLPAFDAETYVEQALTQVPAAEKANAQHLSQYQAISRRFWAAQQPSAYLMGQVQQGQPNPVFKQQALLVISLWHDFDRTLTYSYAFGPVMGDHLRRMKAVAKQQRGALIALANAATMRQPLRLTQAQLVAGQQALPQLLAPLQPRP